MHSVIWKDLGFFVRCLKGLPVSRSMMLSDEAFCVSTGTESENWVYCPEEITDINAVSEAAGFFRERGEVFMWPVYSGGSELLESAGLVYAGDLAAMTLDPGRMKHESVSDEVVVGESGSPEEWAMTAWRGFGGEAEELPENYREFVRALSESESVRLYTARYEGENAGVFAVTSEADMMGVYYFAVKPELRRKGIARAMMSEICRLAEDKKIVLQSTPMGRKFYRNFGFSELFMIPVYSTTDDIF